MQKLQKMPKKQYKNASLSKKKLKYNFKTKHRFISFITSEACEKCKNEKRKTINGEDLLYANNILGFESYVDILKLYLSKYREVINIY